MKFDKFFEILKEEFGANKLSDVAKELKVSPQVVNNWKNKNQVPYKYVITLRKKTKNKQEQKLKPNTLVLDRDLLSKQSNSNITIYTLIKFSIKSILKNKIKILYIVTISVLISIINSKYFTSPVYESNSKIITISESSGSKIGGLATQFGISLPPTNTNNDQIFNEIVPEILKTRTLIKSLLIKIFHTRKFGDGLSLIDIYSKTITADSIKLEEAIVNYIIKNDIIEVQKSNFSPVVTITTKGFEANFAKQLNQSVISELQLVVNNFKTSRTKEKLNFIKSRFNEVKQELRASEEILKEFREKNRLINESPALLLEEERLSRDLFVIQQIFTTLKQEYELLQIELIANDNNIVIIENPTLPLRRTSPNTTQNAIIIFILSFLFSALFFSFLEKYSIEKIATELGLSIK